MDDGLFHLIIYMWAGKDMVDTLPLALITVGASDIMITKSILSEVVQTVLRELLENIAVRAIVEVAGDEEVGIGRKGTDRVDGLTETVYGSLTEGMAVS